MLHILYLLYINLWVGRYLKKALLVKSAKLWAIQPSEWPITVTVRNSAHALGVEQNLCIPWQRGESTNAKWDVFYGLCYFLYPPCPPLPCVRVGQVGTVPTPTCACSHSEWAAPPRRCSVDHRRRDCERSRWTADTGHVCRDVIWLQQEQAPPLPRR